MIDVTDMLATYLASQTTLTAITSTRLWQGRVTPPTGYRPSLGGAIAYRARGGPAPDYHSQIMRTSYQFKCYGESEKQANQVYRALYDVLQDKSYSSIIHAEMEVAGQELRERAMEPNDWPYTLTFFMLSFRK